MNFFSSETLNRDIDIYKNKLASGVIKIRARVKWRIKLVMLAVVTMGIVSACASSDKPQSAQQSAQHASATLQSQIYKPKNFVEFHNYNRRQELVDQPNTIWWCTAYYNNPNIKPVTVPIAGKITSGTKRPYPTSVAETGSDNQRYYTEVAGPDAMDGPSDDYVYGFTPQGAYWQRASSVPLSCTTEPTVYQATETTIVLKVDDTLAAASQAAQATLATGRNKDGTVDPQAAQKAQQQLQQAITAAQKGQ